MTENPLWYYREKLHITATNVFFMLMSLLRPALTVDLALALELALALALAHPLALSPALVLELTFVLLLSKSLHCI